MLAILWLTTKANSAFGKFVVCFSNQLPWLWVIALAIHFLLICITNCAHHRLILREMTLFSLALPEYHLVQGSLK